MPKESLQLCAKCLLPETHETITFDAQGLCSVCVNSQEKQTIDWESRQVELAQIALDTKALGSNYDCVEKTLINEGLNIRLIISAKNDAAPAIFIPGSKSFSVMPLRTAH